MGRLEELMLKKAIRIIAKTLIELYKYKELDPNDVDKIRKIADNEGYSKWGFKPTENLGGDYY